MTLPEVLIAYQDRLREVQVGIANARLHSNIAALVLIAGMILFLLLGFFAIRQQASPWWPSIPLPVVAASARRYRRSRESGYRMSRLAVSCDRALKRIEGAWRGSGATGREFADSSHPYAADLSVVGEGSLFELLCVARTAMGRRGLAGYLLEPATLEETLARQEAVHELQQRTDLREHVALLGKFAFLESKWDTFDKWLQSPEIAFPRYLPTLAAVTSAVTVAVVLCGLFGSVPWLTVLLWIIPLLAFHGVAGLMYRRRVNEMHRLVHPASFETEVLREGLRLLEETQFQSAKLKDLSARARGGPAAVRRLENLLNTLNARDKDWFYGPSRLLLAGTRFQSSSAMIRFSKLTE
jgi:hypothetical protein